MSSIRSHSFDEPQLMFASAPPPSAATSPTFEMPDVVVYPPEEQPNVPPFHAFVAADVRAPSSSRQFTFTTPEMTSIESRLELWQQTVNSSADILLNMSTRRVNRRDTLQYARGGTGLGIYQEPFEGHKRPSEDEDIIEIVKVPRGRAMQDVADWRMTQPKKSIKARASTAFRSIRGKGKAQKPPVPAKENAPVATTRPLSPPAVDLRPEQGSSQRRDKPTRKLSRPLVQMFTFAPDMAASAPDAPDATRSVGSHASVPTSTTASLSSSGTIRRSKKASRPPSPDVFTKTARRKLSFASLQALFTAPPPESSADTAPDSGETTPTRTNKPLPPISQDPPSTPSDDEFFLPSIPNTPCANKGPQNGGVRRPFDDMDDDMGEPEAEISFEMRLNSLHFDDLSFDIERFEVDDD